MTEPLKPIFKKWDNELGSWVWGLSPGDFGRVQAGYACERCLEPFSHYVAECYLCGHPNQNRVIELPAEWQKQGA